MKLYNGNLSNYASKVRLAIYEKKAPVEIVPIPGGDTKSAEYLRVYPLGKLPCLDVDGLVVGESEVINEYLEDKFPQPALLPKDAEGRARARGVSRFHDLYLEPPLRALFPQVTGAEPKNPKLVEEKLAEVRTRLDQLEGKVVGPFAAGAAFTLADCALVPTMLFATLMLPMLGTAGPLEGRPKLAAWWAKCQERPSVQKVLGEMQQALAEMRR